MAKLNKYTYQYFHQEYFVNGKTTQEIASNIGVAGSSVVRKMRKLGFDLSRRYLVKCTQCNTEIERHKSDLIKHNNFYCSKECEGEHKRTLLLGINNPFYGRKHSNTTKQIFSKIHSGKTIPLEMRKQISSKLSGKNSPHWKNGSAERNRNDRMKIEYRIWRTNVFERDNFTCQCCKQIGHELQAHHIKNFSTSVSLRFHINNGVTLCKNCHTKFHSEYGKYNNDKYQLEKFFHRYSNDERETAPCFESTTALNDKLA